MEWFWLIAAAGLFLWSLLAIFRAGNLPLFFLAVAATTYGNILAALSLLVFVGSGEAFAKILAYSAAILFLTPEFRAQFWRLSRDFEEVRGKKLPGRVVEQTIEYGSGLRADCFFVPHETPKPLLLVVHGGGWQSGDPRECAGFLRELARMGLFVASVTYRLAPAAQWPAQREDVLLGLQEILARHEECNINVDKVWLFGRSAGGQIASAIACTEKVSGCICLYSPFDLVFAYEHGQENDMLRSPQLLRQYLGGSLAERRENYLSASAFHQVTPASPPFLLLHGTRDELVWNRQSRRFAQKIRELGGRCEFLEFPWATHAFDHNVRGPAAQITLEAMRRFIFGDTALATEAPPGRK